jgi:transcriptional regulator with XRE-family HTH domain
MAKAGRALKQVLETYGITQNKLAVTMGITRSSIHRWIYEISDPVGDAIIDIRDGLQKISPEAAEEFKRLFWGEGIEE